jgi:hypothetical protein
LKLPIGEGASDGIRSVLVYSAKKTNRYSYSDTSNKTGLRQHHREKHLLSWMPE